MFKWLPRKRDKPFAAETRDLSGWTNEALRLKMVRLLGEIDGCAGYRRSVWQGLQKTINDISALEALRRNVDIGEEQDTLDHLRFREAYSSGYIEELSRKIEGLKKEYEIFENELNGRGA